MSAQPWQLSERGVGLLAQRVSIALGSDNLIVGWLCCKVSLLKGADFDHRGNRLSRLLRLLIESKYHDGMICLELMYQFVNFSRHLERESNSRGLLPRPRARILSVHCYAASRTRVHCNHKKPCSRHIVSINRSCPSCSASQVQRQATLLERLRPGPRLLTPYNVKKKIFL